MKTKFALAVLLALPAFAGAGLDEAVEAYRSGNYAAALAQFRQLAEEGDVAGMYYEGYLYQHGYGVPIDYAEAARWYRMAAAKGHSPSQYFLGKMAEKGQGMDPDLVAAYMWLSLAAKDAPSLRDAAYTLQDVEKLERKMTPEQIAKAKALVANWKPEK